MQDPFGWAVLTENAVYVVIGFLRTLQWAFTGSRRPVYFSPYNSPSPRRSSFFCRLSTGIRQYQCQSGTQHQHDAAGCLPTKKLSLSGAKHVMGLSNKRFSTGLLIVFALGSLAYTFWQVYQLPLDGDLVLTVLPRLGSRRCAGSIWVGRSN